MEEIANGIASNPASMHNAQPWLAIADLTKTDIGTDKNLIKGAKIELIGGLHRHAAYKKVRSIQPPSRLNANLIVRNYGSV